MPALCAAFRESRKNVSVVSQTNYTVHSAKNKPRVGVDEVRIKRQSPVYAVIYGGGVNKRPITADNFYATVLDGILDEADKIGVNVLVENFSPERLLRIGVGFLGTCPINGVILAGDGVTSMVPHIFRYYNSVVCIGCPGPLHEVNSVIGDWRGGAASATRLLYERGHSKIGFLWSGSQTSALCDRYEGYVAAMSQLARGFDYALECRIDCVGKSDGRIKQYLQQLRPTAVFCATSGHRADLVRICRELSLNIPSDLSLVTFEDAAPVCVESSPFITVSADANELGRTAVRYLSSLQAFQAHRHSSTHSDSAVSIRVPVRLTKGTSCLPSNSQPHSVADLDTEINSGYGDFNPHILIG